MKIFEAKSEIPYRLLIINVFNKCNKGTLRNLLICSVNLSFCNLSAKHSIFLKAFPVKTSD